MGDKLLLHTVHITFRMDAPEEKRREILSKFRELANACGGVEKGIVGLHVGRNVDVSKGHVSLVQVALFESEEAFQAFRNHEAHKALRNELQYVADWMPADVEVDRTALKALLSAL